MGATVPLFQGSNFVTINVLPVPAGKKITAGRYCSTAPAVVNDAPDYLITGVINT
jgi:hypothetical protein